MSKNIYHQKMNILERQRLKIFKKTIIYSLGWPILFSLPLMGMSATFQEYSFLFGSLPSLVLLLLFKIEGLNVITWCAPFSILMLFIPNIVYGIYKIDKTIIYILISFYFLLSSALGFVVALGQYY